MDRTRLELFFYELLESKECRNTNELTNITNFLADCMNTAILDYCNDNNIDTDCAPVISID